MLIYYYVIPIDWGDMYDDSLDDCSFVVLDDSTSVAFSVFGQLDSPEADTVIGTVTIERVLDYIDEFSVEDIVEMVSDDWYERNDR